MNRSLRYISLWLLLISAGTLGGCLGGGSKTPVVSISGPSTLAMDQGQSVSITASVQHGGGQGVTWTCTGAACTSTSLTNVTGTSVTFTANGSTGTATVTATSVKDTSVAVGVAITVNALPAVTTTQAQLTAAPATVGQAYSFTFTASGGSGTLTWTATGLPANGPSLSSAGVLSGTPTSAGTITFTVTVTDSSAAGAKSATSPSLNLSVSSPGPSITSLSPTSGPVGTAVTITGTNFGATQGTSTVTFNGTAATPTSWSATSIVAPVPTGATTGNVVVTVGGVASAGVTFTVTSAAAACGSGSEALLTGQYAMLVHGFDNAQPVALGAVFDADGAGHIASTVGVEDINSAGNLGLFLDLTIDTTKSFYSVGSNQRGCLTIVTEAGTGSPSPASSPITIAFRFSLGQITSGVAGAGQIIEFDSTGSTGVNTAGSLLMQDTTAFSNSAITGSYAFGASAREVGLGKYGIAGVFTTDGNGNVTAGAADYNTDSGGNLDGTSSATDYPASSLTFNTGATYSIADSGRGDLSFTLSDGTTTVNAVVYVISATELFMLRIDPQSSTDPLFAGQAVQQTRLIFGNGDLNGTAVYYGSGLGTSAGTRTSLAIVTANGSGDFSVTLNQNDSGTLTSGTSSSGTYTVSTNGRALLSGIGKHNLVLYLTGQNEGFGLGAGANCDSGILALQIGSPFSDTSLESPPPYAFGTFDPEDPHVDDSSGVASSDGIGDITGTSDDNSTGNGGTLNPGQAIDYTYAIDITGTGVIPEGCTFTSGTCNQIFIVISPPSATSPYGQVVLMDANPSNTYPKLETAGQ